MSKAHSPSFLGKIYVKITTHCNIIRVFSFPPVRAGSSEISFEKELVFLRGLHHLKVVKLLAKLILNPDAVPASKLILDD